MIIITKKKVVLTGGEEEKPLEDQKDVSNVTEDAVDTIVDDAKIDTIQENSKYITNSGDMVVEDPASINVYPDDKTDDDIVESENGWSPEKAKQDLIQWATDSAGNISKKKLMKFFLDVDGGDAQNADSYRYVVGAIVDGEPHYCPRCLDDSWDLASGKKTGIANRTVMKKIVFLKEREGIPLTEEQLEFTERHMSAPANNDEIKLNESILEDANEMGNVAVVPNSNIKLNSALAGSKVIYEDDDVIEVPVVPMREGVFTGADGIPTLKKYEYFSNDAHWLEGQPILRGHTAPTELVTYKHNRIGKLVNVIPRPDKKDVVAVARYYKNKLSPEDLARIKSDVPYDGSIAYTTHTSMTSGEYNGSKYDAVEDGGYHFYHFAELANGKGACSHEEGCGFLLNEAPKKRSNIMMKRFKNNLRSADVIQKDTTFVVKLNSGLVYEAKDVSDAETYAENYAKFGMKLNYNYPDSEKSGNGPGSCGGAGNRNSFEELDVAMKEFKKGNTEALSKYVRDTRKDTSKRADAKEVSSPKSKTKQNSRLSNSKILTGNNMTDIENVETVEVTPMEDIVQKLNESFEAKLNAAIKAKDEEIAGLKSQVEELVQKQNAVEQEYIDKIAKEDFEAFTQKLNMAHRKDAQIHYENFKADGWKYIIAHPEVFKTDIPKMNARGVPETGENISELAKARAELQKTLSGKR